MSIARWTRRDGHSKIECRRDVGGRGDRHSSRRLLEEELSKFPHVHVDQFEATSARYIAIGTVSSELS